jgi:F-type H+-transporting ATPase subunit alpha
MFYAHSSLLERAGKLAKNSKTLTALPTVLTPSDDITAFLPTSIMSITDGQLIFDLATFRKNIRPAVNAALSVSRVGGRAQSARQKQISTLLFKQLAQYRQAEEFAHFGADMAPETKQALEFGRLVYDIFHQPANELYSLPEQQLIFETILANNGKYKINTPLLKKLVKDMGPQLNNQMDLAATGQQLLQSVIVGAAT